PRRSRCPPAGAGSGSGPSTGSRSLRGVVAVGGQAYAFGHVPVEGQHLDTGVCRRLVVQRGGQIHGDRVTGGGEASEPVQNEPGQGVVLVFIRQVEVGFQGDLVDAQPGVQLPATIPAYRGGFFDVVFVGDLAHQFLGHVLPGEQSGQAAVLVDHARHLLAALVQLARQVGQRQGERNDEHVVGDVRDAGLGGPARWDGGGFAQAYQADHVVEGGAEHRVVGVAVAGDELVQFGQGGCGADGYDLDARHHDLLGGVVGEVQGALQNVGLTAGQVTVCLGLVDAVAQLLQGGAVVQFFDRFDAH